MPHFPLTLLPTLFAVIRDADSPPYPSVARIRAVHSQWDHEAHVALAAEYREVVSFAGSLSTDSLDALRAQQQRIVDWVASPDVSYTRRVYLTVRPREYCSFAGLAFA